MVVLCEGDKHYPIVKKTDNDQYYLIREKILRNILIKKIKSFDVGFDYHYFTFRGNVHVRKKKKYEEQCYIVFNEGIELEMHPEHWEDIIIRKDGQIEIDTQSGTIYIKFDKKVK